MSTLSALNARSNINKEYSPLYLLLSSKDINILIIKIKDNKNSNNKDNKNRNKEEIIYNKKIKDKEERPYSRDSDIFKKYFNNTSEVKDNNLSIKGRVALINLNN